MGYVLEFQNDPHASAPVQRAVATNPLNAGAVDTRSLRLATMQVAGYQVPIPPTFAPQVGLNEFDMNLDLRPTKNLFVQIHGDIDLNTGLITWIFQSIDPVTGLPPIDPTVGFLDPGANVSLFFAATPKPGLATGTQVTDQATIVFDANPPMMTAPWTNTLDNTPPVSSVTELPDTEICPNFTVQWSGNDTGAGIQDYTIYVSDNGGDFAPWLTNTSSTSAQFAGELYHTYGFYSMARDLVGNVEAGKQSADTTTTVSKNLCGPIPVINNDQQKERK